MVLIPFLLRSRRFGHWSFLSWVALVICPVDTVLLQSRVFSTRCCFYPGSFRHRIPSAAGRCGPGQFVNSTQISSAPGRCDPLSFRYRFFCSETFLPLSVSASSRFVPVTIRSRVFLVLGRFGHLPCRYSVITVSGRIYPVSF